MKKEDYIEIANEYKHQTEILAGKIERKKELLRGNSFTNSKDRIYVEKQLASLEEMYDECFCTMHDLLRIAKGVRN